MFPQQPQQQFRTAGADVKIFYGASGGSSSGQIPDTAQQSWIKPAGISHVYMLLIGAGGNGDGTTVGGGSGAVTVWYGAASNIPASLVVSVPGTTFGSLVPTTVSARFSNSGLTPTALLTANQASTTTGATAMSANQFTASGFFKSTAGANGASSAVSASATTFLSAGTGSGAITANYGYGTPDVGNGFFQLQPIIVGSGNSGTNNNIAAIGCGAAINPAAGGPGMVLIASW